MAALTARTVFPLLLVTLAAFLTFSLYSGDRIGNIKSLSSDPKDVFRHRHVPMDLMGQDPRIGEAFHHFTSPQTSQDDPALVDFIRNAIIEERRPFTPKMSRPLYKTPQAEVISDIFKEKPKGFFVEAGGLDGERSSNTIWFEKTWNWTGLLVEMDPSYYLQLRGKNRMCQTANVCLSTKQHPHVVAFQEMRGGNGAFADKKSETTMDCMCLPLFSLMLALNRTHIDYFSLDVEGQELNVLMTIPFDRLDISVLSVEYLHTDPVALKEFMLSKGYILAETLSYTDESMWQWSYDYIFVKKNSGLL